MIRDEEGFLSDALNLLDKAALCEIDSFMICCGSAGMACLPFWLQASMIVKMTEPSPACALTGQGVSETSEACKSALEQDRPRSRLTTCGFMELCTGKGSAWHQLDDAYP